MSESDAFTLRKSPTQETVRAVNRYYCEVLSNARISLITFLILSVLLVGASIIWFPPNIITWDVFGYYLYLPQVFIYNDLKLQHPEVVQAIIEQYHSSSTFYQAFGLPNGNWVMKFSSGMAVLYLPAFIIGHIIALLTDHPVDGFSFPYQLGMFIEMLIVMILSVWVLRKVLLHFFSDGITAFLLVSVFFGTNYLINSALIGSGVGTQTYLFLLYSAIILLTMKWHKSRKPREIALLGLICGLTVLCRPSEVVCLLIPLLWGITTWKQLKEKALLLLREWKQMLLFASVLLAVGSIQMFYWKHVTGAFILYSYGVDAEAAFNFLGPHIMEVLFSYRKGWYVYTPVMALATIGLIWHWRRNGAGGIAMLSYFVLNLWIVSSWHCWWYAESFGQRALVQSFPVMAIGLGTFLTAANKKWIRGSALTLTTLLIGLNLFQSWQFERGVIDPSRQTGPYYWATFTETWPTGQFEHLKLVKRNGWDNATIGNTADFYIFEHGNQTMEDGQRILWMEQDSIIVKNGKYSARLTGDYSDSHKLRFSDLTSGHYVWLRISVYVYPTRSVTDNAFSLVAGTFHENSTYKYQAVDSEHLQLEENSWNLITMDYLSPEMRFRDDIFKVFVWNRGGNDIYIDDFKVEVFVPRYDPIRE